MHDVFLMERFRINSRLVHLSKRAQPIEFIRRLSSRRQLEQGAERCSSLSRACVESAILRPTCAGSVSSGTAAVVVVVAPLYRLYSASSIVRFACSFC